MTTTVGHICGGPIDPHIPARLDQLVNGPAADVPDRDGDPRYSWRQMMAKNDEVRQNLMPLIKQYMTLAAAQADIANIPEGSTTYYRSPDD
ncbi:hypothetical protein DD582_32425, partial [Klebsiella pneumoniae]